MNGCRNILPVVAAAVVVAQMLAVASCRHGGMTEQEARAAVDTVEAHYKAYTTDSADLPLIADADRRLDCRGVDRHTRARAAVYHGAVYDELGNPDSALIHYKRAETLCDTADHDLLGYINLRIGYLYQFHFCVDTTALSRFRQSLSRYTLANNKHYQIICLGSIGNLYNIDNLDSAYTYLSRSRKMALAINEMALFSDYEVSLAENYFRRKEYVKAKECALGIIIHNNDSTLDTSRPYSIAIQSYAQLGMIDSAKHYLARMPIIKLPADSISYYDAATEIARAQKDFDQFSTSMQQSVDIAGYAMLNSFQVQLKDTEKKYDYQLLENESLKWRFYLLLALMLLLCVAVLAIALVFFNRQKQTKLTNQELTIAQLKNDLELMKTVHVDNHKLQRTIQKQVETVVDFVNLAMSVRTGETQIKDFVRKVKSSITLDSEDKSFWADIQTYADSTHNNLISEIRQKFPQLKQSDLQLMGLMCCGLPTSSIMLCMGYNDIHSLYNKKRRVAQKLGTTETLDNFIKKYST